MNLVLPTFFITLAKKVSNIQSNFIKTFRQNTCILWLILQLVSKNKLCRFKKTRSGGVRSSKFFTLTLSCLPRWFEKRGKNFETLFEFLVKKSSCITLIWSSKMLLMIVVTRVKTILMQNGVHLNKFDLESTIDGCCDSLKMTNEMQKKFIKTKDLLFLVFLMLRW